MFCLKFVDLLDASLLNVALPEISHYFRIDPTNAEWALIGFLLAMVVGMILSNPAGTHFGVRRVFVASQWLYLISSLTCGFAIHFSELVISRIIQGFGGGLALPIGMSMVMMAMPQDKWAKTGSWINFFSLLAPALGPILAGYITFYLNWRWLFFVKLPVSVCALVLSYIWVKKAPRKKETFDWFGLVFSILSLTLFLFVLSEVGKSQFFPSTLIFLFVLSLIFGGVFIWQEKRFKSPLVPLSLFHSRFFSLGNVIQSGANMLFLGAVFFIALYLQWSLDFSIIKTGWMMAAITLGMMIAMPLAGRYYNRIGPLPYMICGLLLMAGSMFSLIFVSKSTPPWIIGFIIACEGAGSAGLQTTNFVSIFSEVPQNLKGAASAVYSIIKQISASFGIALSTMVLSLAMHFYGIQTLMQGAPKKLFVWPFVVLGSIPLFTLICCFFIDNKLALQRIRSTTHLETEFEEGAE